MMDSSRQLVPHDAAAAPANNQLVLCTSSSQPRIRTNIVLLQPLRFYVPDDDASVPYAFMIGQHMVATAGGCQQALLSGYFSILCAVLPDLTDVAKKIMENLGFQAEEMGVPSQTDRMGIAITQSQDLMLEVIKFAQMLFLPFQKSFNTDVRGMWEAVARDVGARDVSSLMVCSMDDMKTISTALEVRELEGALRSRIVSSLQKLSVTSSSFGHIIEKAKKRAMERYWFVEFRVSYALYEGL